MRMRDWVIQNFRVGVGVEGRHECTMDAQMHIQTGLLQAGGCMHRHSSPSLSSPSPSSHACIFPETPRGMHRAPLISPPHYSRLASRSCLLHSPSPSPLSRIPLCACPTPPTARWTPPPPSLPPRPRRPPPSTLPPPQTSSPPPPIQPRSQPCPSQVQQHASPVPATSTTRS